MFKYIVIVREKENLLNRRTVRVRSFNKKSALKKAYQQLLNENKVLTGFEFAAYTPNEYISLRENVLLDSKNFQEMH